MVQPREWIYAWLQTTSTYEDGSVSMQSLLPREAEAPARERPETPTSSQSKRQRTVFDDDTPRPTGPSSSLYQTATGRADEDGGDVFSASRMSISRSASTSLSARSQSRSNASSPVKRELAMRYAQHLRLVGRPIDDSRLPKLVLDLVEELVDLASDAHLLPKRLETKIRACRSAVEPIGPHMFYDEDISSGRDKPESQDENEKDRGRQRTVDLDDQFLHLLEIRDNTRECNDARRPVYEVEWNETVHSRVLRLACRRRPWLKCRNLTAAYVAKQFTDNVSGMPDSRVDYGVFITPPEESCLQRGIGSYFAREPTGQLNHLSTFEPDLPLAVSIETKRLAPGVEKADSQLASFGRAHMRLLMRVNAEDSSLVHPLLKVTGGRWEASFMVREDDGAGLPIAVEYGPITLGETHLLTSCYRLDRSLDALFRWAEENCCGWWTRNLGLGHGPLGEGLT